MANSCRRLLKKESCAYGIRMATQPIDTAKLYALTAAGACSVTLTQGEKSITWEALDEGGQTSFIVPAGATVSISDEAALLSPLPANFKGALGAAQKGIGGERILPASMNGATAYADMRNCAWVIIPADATACIVTPRQDNKAYAMQLLLTPKEDMPEGWLSARDHTILWPYGEPSIVQGFRYCVTLIATPFGLYANMTPLGTHTAS